MDTKQPVLYILTNRKKATLYTGMTSNLPRRIYEHRIGAVPGFTRKYGLKKLVYYELHSTLEDVALREKRLKRWHRDWKIELIEKMNPEWNDLYDSLF